MTCVVPMRAEELACEAERLLAQRRLPEALDCFLLAEAAGCEPDRCAAGRWTASMLAGDFEAAWQQSDEIRRRGRPDPNRFWDGQTLDGQRVIVRCLHGFGDAVQFLRYARPLRRIASHVIAEVPPRFVGLASAFDGIDEVITWGANTPTHAPAWDAQVEVMELPYIFRTHTSDLPIARKYLNVRSTGSHSARIQGQPLRVGLNTSVGEWNRERGISFSSLEPLFALRGVQFCDLRPAGEIAIEAACTGRAVWRNNDRCRHSLDGLAETIAELDLVITVDTLAAHLAGALGVRCWLLLQHQADWRWMLDRDDSPWYPSLRLFRQTLPGNWNAVITRVRDELSAESASPTRDRSLVSAI